MYAALLAAKQYRMEHPRKSKRDGIDEIAVQGYFVQSLNVQFWPDWDAIEPAT